jgi:hypothetical protein
MTEVPVGDRLGELHLHGHDTRAAGDDEIDLPFSALRPHVAHSRFRKLGVDPD